MYLYSELLPGSLVGDIFLVVSGKSYLLALVMRGSWRCHSALTIQDGCSGANPHSHQRRVCSGFKGSPDTK